MTSISVIIPTRNRADLLLRTLTSLANVELHPDQYEVIVIDTASTDNTRKVCQDHGSKILRNFRYDYCDRPGLHIGRHRGAKCAQGDVLVYADDDIRPFPTWLTAISEAFVTEEVSLVGGNNFPDYEADPPDWVETLWHADKFGKTMGCYSLLDLGNTVKEIPPWYAWGCNFSIRKELLFRLGGFHPDGMPQELVRYRGDGETALSYAIEKTGLKAKFVPEASIYHYVPRSRMTFEYLYKRGFVQGISDSFTDVRRLFNSESLLSDSGSLLENSKQRLRYTSRALRLTLMSILRRKTPFMHYLKGHATGYRFHQSAVKNDPALLKWVLLQDYWDESISPCL